MSFTNLGLSKPILKAIEDQGYTSPSPIQAQAIPLVLEGKDVLAGAQTGTGKTAGFTLPILELMTHRSNKKQKFKVRALILTPTRELAAQVHQNVVDYSKYLPFTSAVVFGGVGINPQKSKLKNGVDVLVATPGRLLDLIGQKALDLSAVEFFVLDEADRMLDMGFVHDIKKVLKMLPDDKQSLLFSATFSASIKKLADSLLDNPTLIEVAKRNTSAQTISQKVHFVDKGRKKELLVHLIKRDNWHQVLVFTRTKHGANKLTQHLEFEGIKAAAIHGNKSQGARTRALADFKANQIQVLVATDIAARGIDIDQLPHVINFELPNVPEDYVHRIGRTGRAGNEGVALSLVCVDEHEFLEDIEKLIKKDIEKEEIDGFAVDPTIKAEPKKKQGGNRGRGGRGRGNAGGNSRGNGGGQSRGNGGGNSRGGQSSRRNSNNRRRDSRA